MPAATITVRDLRRLWKPHKERLNGQAAEHPTTIRFHRACSWLQRAEQQPRTTSTWRSLASDAFNAIYGSGITTDESRLPTTSAGGISLKRMLDLDKGDHIVDCACREQAARHVDFRRRIPQPLLLAGANRQAGKSIEEDDV